MTENCLLLADIIVYMVMLPIGLVLFILIIMLMLIIGQVKSWLLKENSI